MVKSASQGISAGCGVRVVVGERTGYAYTDDLSSEHILHAARTAALIASGPAKTSVGLKENARAQPVSGDASVGRCRKAGQSRTGHSRRPVGPRLRFAHQGSPRQLCRRIARHSGDRFRRYICRGLAAVVAAERFLHRRRRQSARGSSAEADAWRWTSSSARRLRSICQGSGPAGHSATRRASGPAGEMEVVLGPGWPGVLLHEAIGHGLEADFNRKKTSAFAGLLGKRVASDKCTVVDNGTLTGAAVRSTWTTRANAHTEHRADRERHSERLPGRQAFVAPDGNAQHRQRTSRKLRAHSHAAHDQHLHAGGADDPEDIIRAVKHGVYAVNFGGGQVDITNGKFVFSAREAYLIEDGKITAPVKDATLIGNGPDVLTRVSHGGQRPEARRRRWHLRQRRTERPRRRRHSHLEGGPHDRGRDRKERSRRIHAVEDIFTTETPSHRGILISRLVEEYFSVRSIAHMNSVARGELSMSFNSTGNRKPETRN